MRAVKTGVAKPHNARLTLLCLVLAMIFLWLISDFAPRQYLKQQEKMPLNTTQITVSSNPDATLIVRRATSTAVVDTTGMSAKEAKKAASRVAITTQTTITRPQNNDMGPYLAILDNSQAQLKYRLPVLEATATSTIGFKDKPSVSSPHPVVRDGLEWIFPANTAQQTYLFYDPIAQVSMPLDYAGKTKIHDLNAFVFAQEIAPMELTLPGLTPGTKYGVNREVVVEPKSGLIINISEKVQVMRGNEAVVDTALEWDEKTQTTQAMQAGKIIVRGQFLAAWSWLCRLAFIMLLAGVIREIRVLLKGAKINA
ncbi:porin PorA family protein [Corynebacterium caspium]|uniref:porin PorA family protein n=1 Tax=Corynebacterium caspium TaxID=234828 RepID=UPI000377175D|nr:porin PorA family protein [Corynebacterium caspium]WKD59956.1 hypothetical protein CCASP_07905 [Corynebacterium caspium DSM 44850]